MRRRDLLRVRHDGRADERFRRGSRRKIRQRENLLALHRRPSAARPRISQKNISRQAMSEASAGRLRSMSHVSVQR